jgi:hypothetical protein
MQTAMLVQHQPANKLVCLLANGWGKGELTRRNVLGATSADETQPRSTDTSRVLGVLQPLSAEPFHDDTTQAAGWVAVPSSCA